MFILIINYLLTFYGKNGQIIYFINDVSNQI